MDPVRLSASLRSVADRLDRSLVPSRSAVASELRRLLAAMTEMKSWRKTILDVILEQGGEVSADSLHEGAEDDADLEEALEAADQLVADGLLAEKNGVYTVSPGREADVQAAAAGSPAAAGAAGSTKIVVSESWTLGEVQAIAREFGGTDLREGPYGDVGLVVPADKVDAVQEGGGEFHVFDSWDEASGGDPEFAFEPVAGPPPVAR